MNEQIEKLATLRRIDAIQPIDGADAIECAVVGEWRVVVKKGKYAQGDLAVYCEIDSWIPHSLAPFLSKGQEPKEYNGVKGERLRTVRLRGQLSQGLLLPYNCHPKVLELLADLEVVFGTRVAEEEAQEFDLSEILGIQKLKEHFGVAR
jgi:RNA ligase (TIGR02306 family)